MLKYVTSQGLCADTNWCSRDEDVLGKVGYFIPAILLHITTTTVGCPEFVNSLLFLSSIASRLIAMCVLVAALVVELVALLCADKNETGH